MPASRIWVSTILEVASLGWYSRRCLGMIRIIAFRKVVPPPE